MTADNRAKSLLRFAEFFDMVGEREAAKAARIGAGELEQQRSRTRIQKVKRLTKADAIRAHALGIRLD